MKNCIGPFLHGPCLMHHTLHIVYYNIWRRVSFILNNHTNLFCSIFWQNDILFLSFKMCTTGMPPCISQLNSLRKLSHIRSFETVLFRLKPVGVRVLSVFGVGKVEVWIGMKMESRMKGKHLSSLNIFFYIATNIQPALAHVCIVCWG